LRQTVLGEVMPDQEPFRPGHLPSSPHVHVANRDQAKPMLKLLGRMMKAKLPGKPGKPPARSHGSGRKGLQANQSVAIKHKQIFY
jgi:hypothetical protein